MNHDPEPRPDLEDSLAPVERLITGLWQQREELGSIADELLDIFRRHGLTPPQDQNNRP